MSPNSSDGRGTVTPQPPAPPGPPSQPPSGPPSWVGTGPKVPGHPDRGRNFGSLIGVALILIGLALLGARFVPGLRLWELWPLFVIIPGLFQCFTPGEDGWSVYRFFDGLVTVAIGAILLGNTTGFLAWGVWWEVLQLWPVLLISAGLGILGKAMHQGWLRALSTIVILLAFAYAAAVSFTGGAFGYSATRAGDSVSYSRQLGLVRAATFKLDAGAGDISVGAQPGTAIDVEASSPWGTPQLLVVKKGDTADVVFNLSEDGGVTLYPGAPSASVDVSLGSGIPWDLDFDTGVCELEADLSDVPVRSLVLETGVSSSEIKLGAPVNESQASRVVVESGISSVAVLIPQGAEARIVSDSGLTAHDIEGDFQSLGDGRWETPGYASARQSGAGTWDITVESGIGSFTADTY